MGPYGPRGLDALIREKYMGIVGERFKIQKTKQIPRDRECGGHAGT